MEENNTDNINSERIIGLPGKGLEGMNYSSGCKAIFIFYSSTWKHYTIFLSSFFISYLDHVRKASAY